MVRYRYIRSPLHESAACSPDSVQLSARRRAREGIGSDPILHPKHDTTWHTNDSDRAVLLGQVPSFLAYCFTTCQTNRSVTPSPQCLPARQTHRKSLPAEIAAAASHSSIVVFTQSGTGTVRMWPPLPTRSTIAQCSSRCCKCLKSRSANSRRRSPHPSKTARIARFPLSFEGVCIGRLPGLLRL